MVAHPVSLGSPVANGGVSLCLADALCGGRRTRDSIIVGAEFDQDAQN